MKLLIMLLTIVGNAPICHTDGYYAYCQHYSWQSCYAVMKTNPNWGCIVNPGREG